MSEKINIAELLKDCPSGMELYSPLCGKCVFDRLNMGTIICKKQNTQEITFTSEGYYMIPVFDNCECMIFPSKDQRDWSKFHRPFNDGDILAYTSSHTTVFIYRNKDNEPKFTTSFYVGYTIGVCYCDFHIYNQSTLIALNGNCDVRLATEEEKAKLFKSIKDNGYRWNPETKTLEKLIEPIFKVGDKISLKCEDIYWDIKTIEGDWYICTNGAKIHIGEQHHYELVPVEPKFKVGDKIKHKENTRWVCLTFSFLCFVIL